MRLIFRKVSIVLKVFCPVDASKPRKNIFKPLLFSPCLQVLLTVKAMSKVCSAMRMASIGLPNKTLTLTSPSVLMTLEQLWIGLKQMISLQTMSAQVRMIFGYVFIQCKCNCLMK